VFSLALFMTVFLWSTAEAQNEARLVLKTEAAKEIRVKEGNGWITKYEPVSVTKPGDVLRYTITYTNEGNSPAVGARIVDPIPPGTVYVMGSASSAGTELQFSIDGGAHWQSLPVMHLIKKPDGSEKEEAAPPELFTHIRWSISGEVPSGSFGKIHFKVTVQ
jgi:uncharacterized repeat protein (TIGR01451 family)